MDKMHVVYDSLLWDPLVGCPAIAALKPVTRTDTVIQEARRFPKVMYASMDRNQDKVKKLITPRRAALPKLKKNFRGTVTLQ